MKRVFSLGLIIGLLIGGLYWYGKYNKLQNNYLQVIKLVEYANKY